MVTVTVDTPQASHQLNVGRLRHQRPKQPRLAPAGAYQGVRYISPGGQIRYVYNGQWEPSP